MSTGVVQLKLKSPTKTARLSLDRLLACTVSLKMRERKENDVNAIISWLRIFSSPLHWSKYILRRKTCTSYFNWEKGKRKKRSAKAISRSEILQPQTILKTEQLIRFFSISMVGFFAEEDLRLIDYRTVRVMWFCTDRSFFPWVSEMFIQEWFSFRSINSNAKFVNKMILFK